MKHVIQDFKSEHKPDGSIAFSFVLEDAGPEAAWALDGKPFIVATARISPNGQLLISGQIFEPKEELTAEDKQALNEVANEFYHEDKDEPSAT